MSVARVYSERACIACEQPFTPTGPRSGLCASCVQPTKPKARTKRPKIEAPELVLVPEEAPASAPITAVDVVEMFDLDFSLGNAVLFILDHRNGDVRANLLAAQDYLSRAIRRMGGV